MPHRLRFPLETLTAQNAVYYRVHVGHRENATELAIKLIQRAVEIDKATHNEDAFLKEMDDIGERWAIDHIIQGCYIEEYHQWERGIKEYFRLQRELNGLHGDFDWKSGRANFVQRTVSALSFFSASVDKDTMNTIDLVRKKVNSMKHDPLAYRVEQSDYKSEVKAFQDFWDRLIEIETAPLGHQRV